MLPGPETIAALCLLSAALTLAVAVAAWRQRPRPAATWLAVLLVGQACWALGQGLSLAADSLRWAQLWFGVTLLGFALAPLAWLLFAVRYTGRDGWLTRPRLAAAWTLPAVYAGLAFTNPAELIYVEPRLTAAGAFAFEWGPFALLYLGFHEVVVWTGLWLMGRKFRHSRNVYRQRTGLFFSVGALIIAAHLVSLTGLSPFPHFTLGPILYVGIGALSLAVFYSQRVLRLLPFERILSPFRGRFEDLAPIARDVVIEEMGSGVLVFDDDGRVVDINPEARRIFGRTEERIVGRRVRDIVDTDAYLDGVPAFFDPDVTEGTFSNVWLESADGDRRCYDVVLTDLSARTEATGGYVAIVHDVTDKQRRERRLEAQKRELERQNDQLEEFAGIVSHDLRNPLNVAIGFVETAERTGDLDHLEKVKDAHDRMEALIDDMLTLARQGTSIDETEPVPLADAITDAWNAVETSSATLVREIDDDATVDADPGRLRQLFENLFRNAVEHGSTSPDSHTRQDAVEHGSTSPDSHTRQDATEHAGPTVIVEACPEGFAVADDGPGIPPDERDAVLEEGFTTSDDGTGYGLSIVSTIAEAHGWRLSVEESETGGARFEIATRADHLRRDRVAE